MDEDGVETQVGFLEKFCEWRQAAFNVTHTLCFSAQSSRHHDSANSTVHISALQHLLFIYLH